MDGELNAEPFPNRPVPVLGERDDVGPGSLADPRRSPGRCFGTC